MLFRTLNRSEMAERNMQPSSPSYSSDIGRKAIPAIDCKNFWGSDFNGAGLPLKEPCRENVGYTLMYDDGKLLGAKMIVCSGGE